MVRCICNYTLKVLLALYLMTVCVSVQGAFDVDQVPSQETIAERLAALDSVDGELTAQQVSEQTNLRDALEIYQRLDANDERLKVLNQRVDEAPEQLYQLELALGEVEESFQQLTAQAFADMSLDDLTSQQADAVLELQQLQGELTDVNSQLLASITLPERAQQAISNALQRAETLRREYDDREALLTDSQLSLSKDAQLIQLGLARLLAERDAAYNQRELSVNSRLRELAQQRRDLFSLQIDYQEKRLGLLEDASDLQRTLESEQVAAETIVDNSLLAEGNPVILDAQQVNQRISQELLQATDRSNTILRENFEAQRDLDYVLQLQRSLNEQIDAMRGSHLLSLILNEQRQSLPTPVPHRHLQDEIADLRLRQFDLTRQSDQLRHGRRLAIQRVEEAGLEATPSVIDALNQIYRERRELVEQLEQSYSSLLSSAIELQLNQKQLLTTTRELRTTIYEQLFWVANSQPVDINWLRQLPNNIRLEWREGEWRVIFSNHWQALSWKIVFGLPWMLLGLLLIGLHARIKERLATIHSQIGRLKSDTQLHTPKAVLLNALLAIPGPLMLAGVGVGLRETDDALTHSIAPALMQLALSWGVVAWGRRLLAPDGVAERHFTCPARYNAQIRKLLRWLGFALVPVIAIATISGQVQAPLALRPIALGLMVAGLLAMSWWLTKLILAHVPFFGLRLFRLVLGLAMAAIPLVLVGLIVWGYEYTALRLVGRFAITLYLLGLWVVVEATVVRSLAVAARRLAYRRALARRAQAQEEAEGGLEVVEEPPLDMEKINTQSLRLSKLILLIGFSLLLYLVWSDLLSVVGYLDHVSLWDSGDEDLIGSELSVTDVITALLVVAVTFIMARNLPGLLEVMVLSRLALKQGSAYAISSLLSYAIVGTGMLIALATLGVSWDKLQWLVAALSVGLGFGLQEIFANFISGLIILFERPIRIGDTITLGNLHGTVNRIRIRATTVTDFDRKEIIIPNKTFVTDQLINWSLSDNVTRVVLTYGVAHNSDLAKVHQLLRQAADENERVLIDPEPQVFCLSYGNHSFNFELRIFVDDIKERLPATDEINCRVNELFQKAGVRVAFEQVDVWLHRDRGESVKVQSINKLPPSTHS
ncbi:MULTISPECIES: mechanosensitive channel MscK [unclassified Halomonas]|uniref:mechanosensitive channel MscK n=1 Tax=unclassified Halomonas TaxID=2609666 RepID=UPI0040337270